MYSSTTALGARWPNSRLSVQLRVNDSPRFDAKSVVYCHSQTLLAANIAFGGLHRDMPEEKLDLLKLAPESWQRRAQDLRRSCGARRGMFMLAAVFLTTCQTVFSEMPCPHGLPARQTHRLE